ncbi:uncharacterized protein N7500_009420 [Penicillium coprophilum]|nr:uncharacterized protein N7500_009420 [Penicillium coprophilum]KAJ5153981.1 hypothetical protein N7500_009420 [Penicillium coprophilum]
MSLNGLPSTFLFVYEYRQKELLGVYLGAT